MSGWTIRRGKYASGLVPGGLFWVAGVLVHVVGGAVSAGAEVPASGPATGTSPRIVSVKKIWDAAPHNAFTDLARFRGRWWCTFREGDGHVGGNGRLRVLVSTDGEAWESSELLAEDGVDLRDPKLSVTPDERLMIVAGGSVYEGKTRVECQPRVSFSKDGREWTPTQRVLSKGTWLWRVTWHDGRAYGIGYDTAPVEDTSRGLRLWGSRDGVEYESIGQLEPTGYPNETTLRFMPDGRMVALVRREKGNQSGLIGTSVKPYKEWSWREIGHRLGGPDFIILPDGSMWAAGRSHPGGAKTVVARMALEKYEPVLTLPSGGDCSYPGLVWHEGLLWVSYYSSHEGKSSIYLAKVKVGE